MHGFENFDRGSDGMFVNCHAHELAIVGFVSGPRIALTMAAQGTK